MHERCHWCDCAFPVCQGQIEPQACFEPTEYRAKRSAWESSLRGWPGAVTIEELEPREPPMMLAAEWPQGGDEMGRGCCS